MNINENVTFNGQVIVKDANGVDTVAMCLNANLDTGNMNININVSTLSKELVTSNATDVKAQYTDFEATVKARAKELGYVIF